MKKQPTKNTLSRDILVTINFRTVSVQYLFQNMTKREIINIIDRRQMAGEATESIIFVEVSRREDGELFLGTIKTISTIDEE